MERNITDKDSSVTVMKNSRSVDEEESESREKRKQRSGRSRKPSNGEEQEDSDGRNNCRKRSGSDSSRQNSDDDDYQTHNESHGKRTKKAREESSLEKLSSWYQDGELDSRQGRDKCRFKAQSCPDERDRRKATSKISEYASSHGSKSKQERYDKTCRTPERKESSREKGHLSSSHGRNSRRRWDESDKKAEENIQKIDTRGRDTSDFKHEDSKELNSLTRNEATNKREDRRGLKGDSNKSKGIQEEVQPEMDHDRSTDMDRSKSGDDSRGGKNRDRGYLTENRRRRHAGCDDRDSKDGDVFHDYGRDWEPRYGRNRNESELIHGRGRSEAVKTLSNFGISNENYDVIEIQTKPSDSACADPGSNFQRSTDMKPSLNLEEKVGDNGGYLAPAEGSKDRFVDDNTWMDETEHLGGLGRGCHSGLALARAGPQASSGSGSQLQYGSQDAASIGRSNAASCRGNRLGRGGRGRPNGRDCQPVGLPLPMMGSPFVPLGLPPTGPIQQIAPTMSPATGPPISPGIFIQPLTQPIVWPGTRGFEMNLPSFSPVPPISSSPRFPPNMGPSTPSQALLFNPVRGIPPSMPGHNAVVGAIGRGFPDKNLTGWVHPRSSGPPGRFPSRGEQNDYSQNFVDTGMRPQNFIRELELTNVVEDYPKLRELIQKKDEIVAKSATPPMYLKCDLREVELSPDFFGTKFDVILIDPPWEEYVHRAPGVADHLDYWTFDAIANLKIESIADTPSFIFLWVGDGLGLEQGRQCLKKWGFRRCEDICWVKTNKANTTPGLRHDSCTLFHHSKEHCLMGIRGTVRRSTDGHIIHANIDTDVIIAEEPPYGSTQKPEDMYRIVEHFSLGRRRLELFGEDHNIRAGWLTVGKGLSSSNFNPEVFMRNFTDKDGRVWQGGGGRNPPPEAAHLVLTTPEIEALRPKSPMKNQHQLQHQQSATIAIVTAATGAANSSNKKATGNSPPEPTVPSLAQDIPLSNPSPQAPWASPSGREHVNVPFFAGFVSSRDMLNGHVDLEPQRPMNSL